MAYEIIFRGTMPDDDTGDDLREGARKINSNFEELYNERDNLVKDTFVSIDFNNVGPYGITTDVALAVNALPSFEVDHATHQYFYALRFLPATDNDGLQTPNFTVQRFVWKLKLGKGEYGAGGTVLTGADLQFKGAVNSAGYNTITYNLGEIGVTDIQDAVNSTGPYLTPTGANIKFKVERNGEVGYYLYVGDSDTSIGDGFDPTVNNDYIDLSTVTPSINPEDFVTYEDFYGSMYDEAMYKEFATLPEIDLLEKLPYYIVQIGSDYYFASDENNVEQFSQSRIYIPFVDAKVDLEEADFNQNGYDFYDLGSLDAGLVDLETYDFQFWLRFGGSGDYAEETKPRVLKIPTDELITQDKQGVLEWINTNGIVIDKNEFLIVEIVDPLVAEYHFDETTGNLIDHSGKGHHGEVFGSMVRDGESYEGNGTNTSVKIDNVGSDFTPREGNKNVDFTISFVVERYANSGTIQFIRVNDDSGNPVFHFNMYASNGLNLIIADENDDRLRITTNDGYSQLPLNTKTHVVFTFKSITNEANFYINKIGINTNTNNDSSFSLMSPLIGETYLMSSTSGNNLKGKMYDMKITKGKAWTQQDIDSDYNETMI